ncbi:hypothetical protein [Hyalangium rubrum]|uniref:Lipoprotein n=1 Tax=Hyalangium rubrum TaxID=3103134 RepID=A0ABU5H5Z3_9BACT|nr:hypothetical protein [Hyalangium sp. s54d21]MDY7227515.1 hypothetical protein [Hyalangium sp. s54d21]
MKALTLLTLGWMMALPPVPVQEMVASAEVVARVEVKPFKRTSWFFQSPEKWRTTLVPLTVYKGQLPGPVELSIQVEPGKDGGNFTKPPEAGERVAFLRKDGETWVLAEPRVQALRKATPELLQALETPAPAAPH